MMSKEQIYVLWGALLLVMLICRCGPLLLLKGRSLPRRVERAVESIPVAAFTALVANDLMQPEALAGDMSQMATPLLSAALVLFVAKRTTSLIWSAVVGMGVYALLGVLWG